jgi:hypothetical protein
MAIDFSDPQYHPGLRCSQRFNDIHTRHVVIRGAAGPGDHIFVFIENLQVERPNLAAALSEEAEKIQRRIAGIFNYNSTSIVDPLL